MADNSRTSKNNRSRSTRALPSLATLTKQLGAVVRLGLRASALTTTKQSVGALLDLRCVAPPPGPQDTRDERALRFVRIMRELVRDLHREDAEFADGIGRLIGNTNRSSTEPLKDRRQEAARILCYTGMSAETFRRRHEATYLGILASSLREREKTFRLRETRNRMEVSAPADAGVAVDWLDRFQYYYRVWSYAIGLANDIDAVTKRQEKDSSDPALPKYAESSLWMYSRLIVHIDLFLDERGGLWLFSDADVEQEASDALWHISWHSPFAMQDDAHLVQAAVGSKSISFVNFLRFVREDEPGQLLLDRWSKWFFNCTCWINPSAECEVHRVRSYCHTFVDIVDTEWNKIAEWYQNPPRRMHGDTIDVGDLYERFPYRLR